MSRLPAALASCILLLGCATDGDDGNDPSGGADAMPPDENPFTAGPCELTVGEESVRYGDDGELVYFSGRSGTEYDFTWNADFTASTQTDRDTGAVELRTYTWEYGNPRLLTHEDDTTATVINYGSDGAPVSAATVFVATGDTQSTRTYETSRGRILGYRIDEVASYVIRAFERDESGQIERTATVYSDGRQFERTYTRDADGLLEQMVIVDLNPPVSTTTEDVTWSGAGCQYVQAQWTLPELPGLEL